MNHRGKTVLVLVIIALFGVIAVQSLFTFSQKPSTDPAAQGKPNSSGKNPKRHLSEKDIPDQSQSIQDLNKLKMSGVDREDREDPTVSFTAYAKTFDLSDPKSFEKLFAMISELPTGDKKSRMLLYLCSGLGRFSSDEAFALLDGIEDERAYKSGLTSIMAAMARSRPEDALSVLKREYSNSIYKDSLLRFVQSQSKSEEGLERIMDLSEVVFEKAPDLLKHNFLSQMKSTPYLKGQDLITELVNQESGMEPDVFHPSRASRFNSALDGGSSLADVLKSISKISDPRSQSASRRLLFEGLTRESPKSAVEGLSHLSNSEATEAAPGIVRQWYSLDRQEAGEWVDELPSGATKDAAISTIIKLIGDQDPEAVSEWEKQMSSSE